MGRRNSLVYRNFVGTLPVESLLIHVEVNGLPAFSSEGNLSWGSSLLKIYKNDIVATISSMQNKDKTLLCIEILKPPLHVGVGIF